MQGKSLETTPLSIAKKISKKLALQAMVARVTYSNRHSKFFEKVKECEAEDHEHFKSEKGELVSLNTPLEGDCKLELLDFGTEEGKQTFWHSSAHVLGNSMETIYGAFLTHGPPLNEGYYYDSFIGDQKIHKADYQKIEKSMHKIVSSKVPFE